MINDGITFFIVFEGIANPIPADAPVVENIAVFIPITSPCTFRGPPEFPGLIGASV